MSDLTFAIIMLLFCATGYYFSWRYYRKGNWAIAVFLLMICGLVLRIYTSSDFFLHPWDERFHALVAKNLIHHPLKPTLYENPVLPYDYRNWTGNHIWVHKQPLPLWAMSLSLWLFGINELALRIPSIILTTIGIWLTFIVGNYFSNKKTGYVAAFFYSINGLIIEMTAGRTATDHIDIFFLFFIELGIVFTILFIQNKKNIFNIMAGISIGAAVLSKWLPALIVVPVWLLLILDSKKFSMKEVLIQLGLLLLTCVVFIIPWQLYILRSFRLETIWESSYNMKHITEVLDQMGGPIYFYFDKIRISFGDLLYLPMIWFVWQTIRNYKDKKRLAVLIWIFIPILFFTFVKTKMQAYVLFIAPALFYITADFFFMLNDYRKNSKLKWLYTLVLLLIIAFPVNYMFERVKPFQNKDRHRIWVTELRNMNKQDIQNGILFNYNKPIEAMFYTNLTVYPDVPDKISIERLIASGYTVIINENSNLSNEIRSIPGIQIIKLSK